MPKYFDDDDDQESPQDIATYKNDGVTVHLGALGPRGVRVEHQPLKVHVEVPKDARFPGNLPPSPQKPPVPAEAPKKRGRKAKVQEDVAEIASIKARNEQLLKALDEALKGADDVNPQDVKKEVKQIFVASAKIVAKELLERGLTDRSQTGTRLLVRALDEASGKPANQRPDEDDEGLPGVIADITEDDE